LNFREETMVGKRIASLLAVSAIGLVGLISGAQASQPAGQTPAVALAAKTCGHGTPAQTPGGVKCLAPGEYCSHKPGYAKAYRRAGFRCNRKGRLEKR
jgi:hypothetical protein